MKSKKIVNVDFKSFLAITIIIVILIVVILL